MSVSSNAVQCLAVVFLSVSLVSSTAGARECPPQDVCVERPDILLMAQLAREAQCRATTEPEVTAEPITILLDKQGRVFGSGTGDKPFTLRLDWCNYEIEMKSQIRLIAAQAVEPHWGFRLRPKASVGILTRELLDGETLLQYGDVGLMLEPFFYRWFNVNGYVSFRSVGAGLGFDITTNFGAAVLFNTRWGEWRVNPFVAVFFAL